jgi:hypothetical protein
LITNISAQRSIAVSQEKRQVTRENGIPEEANDLPECCGTGCAVCVLDYPGDTGGASTGGGDLLRMIEAIESVTGPAVCGLPGKCTAEEPGVDN